ncbi:MAG: hypothetical protein ACXQTR_02510 [Candidatus Methanospirareceae archaeon]
MATQDEVLEAFRALGGSANIKELKEYFGIAEVKGSSWIPQRLAALERKGMIERIVLSTGKTRYVLVPEV